MTARSTVGVSSPGPDPANHSGIVLDSKLLPLENEQAKLRAMSHDDAAAYAEGTKDQSVRLYAHLPEPEYTAESVARIIEEQISPGLESGELAVLTIADPDTNDFAGSLALFDVDKNGAEVGFWLHPNHRGKGLTSAALKLAVEFIGKSSIPNLTARTIPENTASQRVSERAGFELVDRNVSAAPSGKEVEPLNYQRSTQV